MRCKSWSKPSRNNRRNALSGSCIDGPTHVSLDGDPGSFSISHASIVLAAGTSPTQSCLVTLGMIAAFNRGYNGFQQTYRTCTPAAMVAIRRYIDEGSKISRDLTARYAN